MGHLGGGASVEIGAPLAEVWAVVQDVMAAPEWQGSLDKVTAQAGQLTCSHPLRGPDTSFVGAGGRRPEVRAAMRAIFANGRPDELRRRVEGG